ncbi:glutathione peroxidase [Pradoshia sp. D12]|uniref:glutathione peroxidase n=1 Tax=Bacillaceae TaxID=186817 RepID=UPI001123AE7F|nr:MULTISPECIES: glutathione peroxidase [Bacillaceae]QFK71407.1 glutathione peroxidase [Pradoshia sp. D12]TPF73202.1 glutathione peroxidase [Bacillus sp. D12]
MKSVYDFEVKKTNGKLQSLKEYEGKPLLIVNTASKCGLAPQFKGLQELYKKFNSQGFEVLGFPCDQFNSQEYDDINKTTEFCQINYGVTFPIFAKIDVNGDHADPLFQYLTTEQKGLLSKKIKWNFTKFLIDKKGQVVERYAPTTAPEKIKKDIEEELEK